MTDMRFPFRAIQTARKAFGSSGQGVGWLQDLAVRARNIQAQLEGLNRRLSTGLSDGVPSAVTGEMLFKANTQERITISNFPYDEQNAAGTLFTANLVVNPIIKAGQTYRVPLMLPPPGVFMAHNLLVGIEAGTVLFGGQQRPFITPLNDYRQSMTSGMVEGPAEGNLNFSQQQQVLHGGTDAAFWGQHTYLPFFWNIIDEKSGRQFSQDWLPHGMLMGGRFGAASGSVSTAVGAVSSVMPNDGDFFEFDTPWLFERDAQVTFLFRPIMDLYQMAFDQTPNVPLIVGVGNATLRPYPTTDDRNQGLRNMQATLRVEMHGNRYYTRQDVLKEGAKL